MLELTEKAALAVNVNSKSEIGVQLQNESMLDTEIKLFYVKNGEREITSFVSQKIKPDLQVFVEENKSEMHGLLSETREIAATVSQDAKSVSDIENIVGKKSDEIEQAVTDVVSLKNICVENATITGANAQATMIAAQEAAIQAEKVALFADDVTSLQNATAFTSEGEKILASFGMPSGDSYKLSVPYNGQTVTAPATGYYSFSMKSIVGGNFIQISSGNLSSLSISTTGGQNLRIWLPIYKGKQAIINCSSNLVFNSFVFIYAEGAK